LSADDKVAIDAHNRRIAELNAGKQSHGWIQAVYDVGAPPPTHLFERGEYLAPQAEVPPGFLSVMANERDATFLHATPPNASSGRRLAFARWLTDRTRWGGAAARVMVNRVWQHCGRRHCAVNRQCRASGVPPTHPELLDWLAAGFIEQGWRLKPLIRQIVTSSVYRQASFRDSPQESSVTRGRLIPTIACSGGPG